MNRVGEFEKVSFEQYYEAIKDEFYSRALKRLFLLAII